MQNAGCRAQWPITVEGHDPVDAPRPVPPLHPRWPLYQTRRAEERDLTSALPSGDRHANAGNTQDLSGGWVDHASKKIKNNQQ
jgi:hypothetical protein